ncbi:MAG TPA: OmpA family protein [Burkholderiales bacterium]|nr:OmpA family protein [Burkholderiales bacterium]
MRLALAPVAAVFLAACASTPATNPKLDEARALYSQAAADADAARSAPLELRSAQEALTRAETAFKAGEDSATVDHHAYLARQRSATALQAGEIARAEQAVSASAAERDRILMAARTREAEQARLQAGIDRSESERARMQAEKDRAEAERARMQAEKDRAESERARMQAQTASAEAEQARKAAEAQLAAAQAAQADTAKLKQQLAELEAKQTDRGLVLTLGDVLFDSGRAELKAGAARTVDRLAAFMRDHPERSLQVEGYTDSVGSDALNLALSQRRADAVRAALESRGVEGSRITTNGMGKANPVAGNDTAEGRQRNRRVEIVISGTS